MTKEKIEEVQKSTSEEENIPEEVIVEESLIKKNACLIGKYILEKLKEYRYVMLADFISFLFLFFFIPTIIFKVKSIIWIIAFCVFTLIPIMTVYGFRKIRDRQIMFSFFFIYLLIYLVLDRCTLIDLYGITSHGTLDHTAAWLDAVFVTCIIVFIQYIGILLVNLGRVLLKKIKK